MNQDLNELLLSLPHTSLPRLGKTPIGWRASILVKVDMIYSKEHSVIASSPLEAVQELIEKIDNTGNPDNNKLKDEEIK